MSPSTTPVIEITTYGVLHGEPPAARYNRAPIEIDLTTALRNPHHDPAMRELTGLDQVVYQHVMDTEGARELLEDALDRIALASQQTSPLEPVEVHVYCKGGRHRSVSIGRSLAETLTSWHCQVTLTHRDVAKPVVQS